jgi:hypothetical protein
VIPTLKNKLNANGEGRVRAAPMVRVHKKARGRTTGSAGATGLPCAMVLTVSFVLSAVRPGFVVTVIDVM